MEKLIYSIDWNKFTVEERISLQKTIDAGRFKDLMCVLPQTEMDQEKEIEIQKFLDSVNGDDENFKSELEIDKEFLQKDPASHTPEQEAEWQKKIDEEKLNHKVKVDEKKKSILDKLLNREPAKVVEPKVVEPKVVEPKVVEPKVVEPKVVEPKVVEKKNELNTTEIKTDVPNL
jgi:hypothetical protein